MQISKLKKIGKNWTYENELHNVMNIFNVLVLSQNLVFKQLWLERLIFLVQIIGRVDLIILINIWLLFLFLITILILSGIESMRYSMVSKSMSIHSSIVIEHKVLAFRYFFVISNSCFTIEKTFSIEFRFTET